MGILEGLFPSKLPKFYQQIIDNCNDAVIILDKNGQIININRRSLRLFDWKKNEVLNKKMDFVFGDFEDNKLKLDILIEKALNGKRTKDYDWRIKRKEKRYILNLNIERLIDENGEAFGVLVNVKDVSLVCQQKDRLALINKDFDLIKKMNQQILKGKKNAIIIKNINAYIKQNVGDFRLSLYLFDENKNELRMQNVDNEYFYNLVKPLKIKFNQVNIKLNPNYLYTKTIKENKPVLIKDSKQIIRLMTECTENKSYRKYAKLAYNFLQIKSVLLVPLIVGNKIIGLVDTSSRGFIDQEQSTRIIEIAKQFALMIDVKRTKNLLINELEWSDKILDLAPSIVVGLSGKGKIEIFNKSAERITGYKYSEVFGKNWMELFIEKKEKNTISELWNQIHLKKSIGLKNINKIICKDGSEKIISWNSAYITMTGKKDLVLSIGQDITQQVKLRKELERANEELKSVEKLRSIILRDISHELKTPASNIKMLVNLLDSELIKAKPNKELMNEYMQLAIENSDRFLEHADKVLQLSEIKSLNKFKKQRIDLKELIEEIVDRYAGKLLLKKLKIKLDVEKGCYVYASRDLLKSVVKNLLDNAIKFSDKGKIRIICKKTKKNIRLKIADQGIGIRKKDMRKLFKPFIKIDPTKEGLGLGLSIVKKILEINKSNIRIASEYKKGTTVNILFPRNNKITKRSLYAK